MSLPCIIGLVSMVAAHPEKSWLQSLGCSRRLPTERRIVSALGQPVVPQFIAARADIERALALRAGVVVWAAAGIGTRTGGCVDASGDLDRGSARLVAGLECRPGNFTAFGGGFRAVHVRCRHSWVLSVSWPPSSYIGARRKGSRLGRHRAAPSLRCHGRLQRQSRFSGRGAAVDFYGIAIAENGHGQT